MVQGCEELALEVAAVFDTGTTVKRLSTRCAHPKKVRRAPHLPFPPTSPAAPRFLPLWLIESPTVVQLSNDDIRKRVYVPEEEQVATVYHQEVCMSEIVGPWAFRNMDHQMMLTNGSLGGTYRQTAEWIRDNCDGHCDVMIDPYFLRMAFDNAADFALARLFFSDRENILDNNSAFA